MSHASTTTPTQIYSIKANYDIVRGDKLRFSEAVFDGEGSRARLLGMRTVEARVVADSSRAGRRPGMVALLVIASDGLAALPAGAAISREAGVLFRHDAYRSSWRKEHDRRASAGKSAQRRARKPWRAWLIDALTDTDFSDAALA
jgi:hypothetical protein